MAFALRCRRPKAVPHALKFVNPEEAKQCALTPIKRAKTSS